VATRLFSGKPTGGNVVHVNASSTKPRRIRGFDRRGGRISDKTGLSDCSLIHIATFNRCWPGGPGFFARADAVR